MTLSWHYDSDWRKDYSNPHCLQQKLQVLSLWLSSLVQRLASIIVSGHNLGGAVIKTGARLFSFSLDTGIMMHTRTLPVQGEKPWKELSLLVAHCSTSCCFFAWPLVNWKGGSKMAFQDYTKPRLRLNLLPSELFCSRNTVVRRVFVLHALFSSDSFVLWIFQEKHKNKRHCSEQTISTNWEIKKESS